jgi:hypothetical protein
MKQLNLEDNELGPAIETEDGLTLSIRRDVSEWLEEQAKELGLSGLEEMVHVMLSSGIYSISKKIGAQDHFIPEEYRNNPKVMALFSD